MAADTWKADERAIADIFNDVLLTEERFGHTCKRIPLSGSNNRRTDGSSHHGDIAFPDELDIHVELKRRKSYVHQTTMDAAKADAKKHGFTPENVILITKTLRQRGFTAVIDADLLFKLLALPGAIEIFAMKEKPLGKPGSDSVVRPRRRKPASQEPHQADERGNENPRKATRARKVKDHGEVFC